MLFGDIYGFIQTALIESVFDFGTFELGDDDGYLTFITFIIDLAYLGIIFMVRYH